MNLNEVADRLGSIAIELDVIADRLDLVYGKLTGEYKSRDTEAKNSRGDTIYHKLVITHDFQLHQTQRLFQVLGELESLVADYAPPEKAANVVLGAHVSQADARKAMEAFIGGQRNRYTTDNL